MDGDGPGLGEHLGDVAFLARILSDENRLRILLRLGQGQASVNRIAEDLLLSQPLVSHHLRELKRGLLVRVERRGPFVYYELSRPDLPDLLGTLADLAQGLVRDRTGLKS